MNEHTMGLLKLIANPLPLTELTDLMVDRFVHVLNRKNVLIRRADGTPYLRGLTVGQACDLRMYWKLHSTETIELLNSIYNHDGLVYIKFMRNIESNVDDFVGVVLNKDDLWRIFTEKGDIIDEFEMILTGVITDTPPLHIEWLADYTIQPNWNEAIAGEKILTLEPQRNFVGTVINFDANEIPDGIKLSTESDIIVHSDQLRQYVDYYRTYKGWPIFEWSVRPRSIITLHKIMSVFYINEEMRATFWRNNQAYAVYDIIIETPNEITYRWGYPTADTDWLFRGYAYRKQPGPSPTEVIINITSGNDFRGLGSIEIENGDLINGPDAIPVDGPGGGNDPEGYLDIGGSYNATIQPKYINPAYREAFGILEYNGQIWGLFSKKTDGLIDPFASSPIGTRAIKWVNGQWNNNSGYYDFLGTDGTELSPFNRQEPVAYASPFIAYAHNSVYVVLNYPTREQGFALFQLNESGWRVLSYIANAVAYQIYTAPDGNILIAGTRINSYAHPHMWRYTLSGGLESVYLPVQGYGTSLWQAATGIIKIGDYLYCYAVGGIGGQWWRGLLRSANNGQNWQIIHQFGIWASYEDTYKAKCVVPRGGGAVWCGWRPWSWWPEGDELMPTAAATLSCAARNPIDGNYYACSGYSTFPPRIYKINTDRPGYVENAYTACASRASPGFSPQISTGVWCGNSIYQNNQYNACFLGWEYTYNSGRWGRTDRVDYLTNWTDVNIGAQGVAIDQLTFLVAAAPTYAGLPNDINGIPWTQVLLEEDEQGNLVGTYRTYGSFIKYRLLWNNAAPGARINHIRLRGSA